MAPIGYLPQPTMAQERASNVTRMVWGADRRTGLRRRAGGKSKGNNPDDTPDCDIHATCLDDKEGRDIELGLTILIALVGLAMCMAASFGLWCCCCRESAPENTSKVVPDAKYLVSGEEEREIAAATKIQSLTRGRLARKKHIMEDLAAKKIQAIYRGKSIRSAAAKVGKLSAVSAGMNSRRNSQARSSSKWSSLPGR